MKNILKVAYFPGDPGEDEDEFYENWTADKEPVAAETDKWSSQVVGVKQPLQRTSQDQNDEFQTSRSFWSASRSKKAPSIISYSKRSTKKRSKIDLETKSKLDNSQIDRKENFNVNVSVSNQSNLNISPLDVDPPREIPEEEKYLRDKKSRQERAQEVEMRERMEEEERERQRQKSKNDELELMKKKEHTYDDSGKIIMVKKPNLIKIQDKLDPKIEFNLKAEETQTQTATKQPVNIRIKSARVDPKKKQEKTVKLTQEKRAELKLEEVQLQFNFQQQAEQEVQEKYLKIYENQMQASIEYGQLVDGLDIKEGIIMKTNNRRVMGPPLSRNKMTLQEYQKISQDFEFGTERMTKYGSQKKIIEPKQNLGQISEIDAGEEIVPSIFSNKRASAEKVVRNPGAEEIYDREFTAQEHKINLRAQRKNLKSATARVTSLTNSKSKQIKQMARLNSAKAPSDIRIKHAPSKDAIKGKIFNYENYIGGIDIPPKSQVLSPSSSVAQSRPFSALQSIPSHKEWKGNKKESLIDQYNKKIIEKGGPDRELNHNELPEVLKNRILTLNQNSRPQTAQRPITQIQSRKKIQEFNEYSSLIGGQQEQPIALSQRKRPRERIISARPQNQQEKLPPPPFGKSMGHGFK